MSLWQIFRDASEAYAREADSRHTAVMEEFAKIRKMLMALAPEVQALLDAITAQGTAIEDALAELTTLEGAAATLQTQITALQAQIAAGATVDPTDLAAIVTATGTINSSVANLKSAMPVPVPAPVVAAAAAAAPAAAPPVQQPSA